MEGIVLPKVHCLMEACDRVVGAPLRSFNELFEAFTGVIEFTASL